MNILCEIVRKLFYYSSWQIAYRTINSNSKLPINDNKILYNLIPISDSKHYADPFIFKQDNTVYLFAECMDRFQGKGTIAVSEYQNGKFSKFKEILVEDFHLSFPNVFMQNDDIFMMPETSQKGQVRIYKAKSFPYEWVLHAILLDDEKPYVDSMFLDNDKTKVLCYYKDGEKEYNNCFSLNAIDGVLTPLDKICECNMRPGGNAFAFGDKTYRIVQNCSNYYGQSMFIVDTETPEKIIGEISDKNLCFKPQILKITGAHTFNREAGFEVIDIKYNRFCITKPMINVVNKIKQIWR